MITVPWLIAALIFFSFSFVFWHFGNDPIRSYANRQQSETKDTDIEVELRTELFRRGYRYRLHPKIPGTRTRPDFAFMSRHVAVYVDSCFWHWCPQHGSLPEINAGWWGAKLLGNAERDRRHVRELRRLGWRVVRVWEHEDVGAAANRIEELLVGR